MANDEQERDGGLRAISGKKLTVVSGDRVWSFTEGYKALPRMAKATYSDKVKSLACEGWLGWSNDGYYLKPEALGHLLISA